LSKNGISIPEEKTRLERAFRAELASLPEELTGASDRVLRAISLRPAHEQKWTEQLAPLTTLYPVLQAEAMGHEAVPAARRANVAHLFFLIHAFMEDRFLDGQLQLDRSAALLMKESLVRGNFMVASICEDRALARESLEKLMLQYTFSQLHGLRPSDEEEVSVISPRRVKSFAAGRARYGLLATIALALSQHCGQSTVRKMTNAFDCLVTGLQWTDDLDDWSNDLNTGDDNLLLLTLATQGLDPYEHPANEVRTPNVAHALVEKKVFERATDQARRWFEAAVWRQEALGATSLAGLIRDRIDELPELANHAVEQANALVDAELSKQRL
jgi:hypothetical protein